MKIVIFVFFIAFSVSVIAKELNIGIPFEGTHTQSENSEERKTARDDENSGICGSNLQWNFNNESSTLTISGQGKMSCCNSSYTPWSNFSKQVQNIDIREGVSSIGQYAFKDFTNLKTVNITSSVTSIGKNAFYNCKNLTSITIPSSVKSIGSNAFYNCSSLESVIYLGSNDPNKENATNIFKGCDQLKFVCVSSSYNNNSFCGLTQFCKHDSCESFLHNVNQCYEPVRDDKKKEWKMAKRDNATIWESKSNRCYEFQCLNDSGPVYWKRDNATKWESKRNECYEFQCHNESGPIFWKQCNRTDEVCENDQCVIVKEEVTYSVEIEIDGIDVSDLNMTEIQITISNLTGIEEDKLRIRFDTNDNNEVIRIIVIVHDEKTADKISKSINVAIEEHNKEGFLRYCKSVRVQTNEKNLSISSGIMKEEGIIAMFAIILMNIIN